MKRPFLERKQHTPGASQSKNSGGCPDQSAPVSLASWSYSYIVGSIVRGTEFLGSLEKTETEAYGEVSVSM